MPHVLISTFNVEQTTALVSGAIAIGFLSGAWTKVRNMERFRLICAGYPGAAGLGVANLALGVVVGEITAGLLIAAPYRRLSLIGLTMGVFLVCAATGAIAARRWRGEKRFRCGCGTDLDGESNADWLLLRNFALIAALAVVAAWGPGVLTGGWETAMLPLAAACLVISGRLLAATRLTRARIREWRTHF